MGPCADHDDGSFELPAFAENAEARAAFLDAVRSSPKAGIRDLVEPLGYARRDVTALVESDPVFADEYAVARGYDVDSLRTAVHQRALDGSDRLLEFEAKMRLPEARELQRMRLDGRVEVQPVPYVDASRLRADGIRDELRACTNERELALTLARIMQPSAEQVPEGGRPALELLPGEDGGS